jgi:hypothetical protein
VAGFTQDQEAGLIQARVVALIRDQEAGLIRDQEAGLIQARVVALIRDQEAGLIRDQEAGLIQARVVALMQDRGGLATQALVVKTLTLGIDLTQTVSRGVICREF